MTPDTPAAHPLRGVLLFVAALMLFAAMDATTKYLVADYPAPLVMAVRYIVHCLLMVVVLTPRVGWQLVEAQRTGLVVLRGVVLAAASLCVGLALKRMPVAETTALIFLSPMIVVLLAGPMLGETIVKTDWIAAVLGFGGVLLIARPGSGLDTAGVLLALGAALMTSIYQLLSRMLVHTERVIALLFYTALVGAVIFGLALPWSVAGRAPTPWQAVLFVGMGLMGGVGHYLFTAAYRNAPASLLAPALYLQLLWAALLGWWVFDHVPPAMAIAGMGVVAAAGALVALKSRRG